MELLRVVVTGNTVVMPATHEVWVHSPELGRSASPGQFIFVRCGQGWDPLLRRAISVYRISPDGVSFLVRAGGKGAGIIARARPGDDLDVLGPVGRPFSVDAARRRLLMVGHGYRVGVFAVLADRVIRRGFEVVVLAGGETAADVFPSSALPPEVEYQAATADGSSGHAGQVADLARGYLAWADAVYASGPETMLRAVTDLLAPVGPAGVVASPKPVQVAMERPMPCAMGVCLGCVVKTRRGYQRACREGPVFEAGEIVWERGA